MIVVEGPDGAGKTTLARKLATQLGVEIEPKIVGADTNPIGEVDKAAWVSQDLKRPPGLRIYDRYCLISEMIYGPTVGKEPPAFFDDWQWLAMRWRKFWERAPIVVVCLPPLETVRANVRGDKNNEAVVNHIDALYWGYQSWVAQTRLLSYWNHSVDLWIVDYTETLSPHRLDNLVQYVRAMKERFSE